MEYLQKTFSMAKFKREGEMPGTCGACVWHRGPHDKDCIKVKKLKEEAGSIADRHPVEEEPYWSPQGF